MLSKVENQLLTVSGVQISFVFDCILKLRVGCLSTFRFHIQTSCQKLTRQVERGEEFEKERKASKTVKNGDGDRKIEIEGTAKGPGFRCIRNIPCAV